MFSVQVTQYLLDKTLIMDEDTLYDLSLKIEPRLPAWVTAVCGQWEPAKPGPPRATRPRNLINQEEIGTFWERHGNGDKRDWRLKWEFYKRLREHDGLSSRRTRGKGCIEGFEEMTCLCVCHSSVENVVHMTSYFLRQPESAEKAGSMEWMDEIQWT